MYKKQNINLEVWTIWRPPEAVFENFFYYTVWGIERCEIKNVKKTNYKFGGLDHLEATRGRLRN